MAHCCRTRAARRACQCVSCAITLTTACTLYPKVRHKYATSDVPKTEIECHRKNWVSIRPRALPDTRWTFFFSPFEFVARASPGHTLVITGARAAHLPLYTRTGAPPGYSNSLPDRAWTYVPVCHCQRVQRQSETPPRNDVSVSAYNTVVQRVQCCIRLVGTCLCIRHITARVRKPTWWPNRNVAADRCCGCLAQSGEDKSSWLEE